MTATAASAMAIGFFCCRTAPSFRVLMLRFGAPTVLLGVSDPSDAVLIPVKSGLDGRDTALHLAEVEQTPLPPLPKFKSSRGASDSINRPPQ